MFTVIVRFPLPAGTTREQATETFQASAPNFERMQGLMWKYYLFGEDGTGGAVYVWSSREAANRFHAPAWRATLEQRYGAPPDVTSSKLRWLSITRYGHDDHGSRAGTVHPSRISPRYRRQAEMILARVSIHLQNEMQSNG